MRIWRLTGGVDGLKRCVARWRGKKNTRNWIRKTMSAYLAEFIGTDILVIFGNGVVANVVLARTKGHQSGWIVITAGWGLAVFLGVFCSQPFSGGHLNPAVTIAMAAAGKLEPGKVAGYIIAQFLGA